MGAETPADAAAGGADPAGGPAWSIQLDVFEGPLDLLLHLVKRHELDVLDIPIAFVTEKYLEYLEFMRALDLEIAGEYLVMAATLAYLKSRELLPSEAEDEPDPAGLVPGVDPREELIQRLLEYQTFRDAAHELDGMPLAGRDVFARGSEIVLGPTDPELAPVTLFRLAEAFHRVLQRARVTRSHEVVVERISVPERMRQLTLLVTERDRVDFIGLFLEREWSSEHELRAALVVTLISVLELVRLGVARVHQPDGADSIVLERVGHVERERLVLGDHAALDAMIDGGHDPASAATEPDQEPSDAQET